LSWRGCWLFEADWWRCENDGDFGHGGNEHGCLLWVVMRVLGSRFKVGGRRGLKVGMVKTARQGGSLEVAERYCWVGRCNCEGMVEGMVVDEDVWRWMGCFEMHAIFMK